MKAPGADPAAKLLSTMIDVLTAEMSDPTRFGRGRTYARQGAVSRLNVEPQVLTATVQGSRSEPYSVTIRVPLADVVGDRRSALVPAKRDVTFHCSCPDWDSPCKHAVAVMVFFSQRVAYDPTLLDTWRGVSAAGDHRVPLRGSSNVSAVPLGPTAAELSAWDDYFGSSTRVEIPRLGVPPAAHDAMDDPWSAMLRDALRVLSPPRRGSA